MRAFDPVQLGSIELFCKAAELGSFTAAAEVLGLTPASVSRSISRLEARLGVRLFARTTRHIRLTTEGELYRQQCQQALEQIAEAERIITGNQKVPSGVLRPSVGTPYAHYRLLPLLPEFQAMYPQVEIELSISNRVVDFVDEGFDLAIRLGIPQDSRLIAHTLEDATLGVFAAPSYLKARGTPSTLADLNDHDCLQFVLPSTGRAMPWIFRDVAGKDIDFTFRSQKRVHDDVLGCVNWAIAGGGLFQIYHFIAQAAVDRGELVEVLHSAGGRTRRFSILYPQNRHLSARVRAFVDFIVRAVRHP
ncbi:LysR family transcriptional regulator [Pseudomonas juntendi]|uniref:LysR substrate-binding domain-containing protein n=1 Tax=Pseudomonas juntendi TaxID=2666183 RepID=A0AAJ5S8R1_9PSED|nr:LysR family transcriptional regulator [Pseudomonas juntendi]QOH70179.1 LysR family transcriptional regulator [Pseudomonas putida]WEA22405.1 LysR substrate-binding domain-containing protein [Pseudomonas juntendi]